MPKKPTLDEQGTFFGYTPMLYNGKHWSEAYGYLGSYYLSFQRAKFEIDFIMREFPDKYQEWCVERIVLDQDKFRVQDDRECFIAQSKNAPQ